jgi:hypothetical protein
MVSVAVAVTVEAKVAICSSSSSSSSPSKIFKTSKSYFDNGDAEADTDTDIIGYAEKVADAAWDDIHEKSLHSFRLPLRKPTELEATKSAVTAVQHEDILFIYTIQFNFICGDTENLTNATENR